MTRCRFESQRKPIIRNLLKLYRQADSADVSAGIEWYPKVQAIIREWASHYRYSVDTAACVTAALSPQLEWNRNLVIADDVLAGRAPSIGGVLHSNLRKAEQLRDSDWKTDRHTIGVRMLEVFPGGPKVNSFAHNLAGDSGLVTIDSHAVQAALNDPLFKAGIPWTPYRIFAECYAVAAHKVERLPAEFQAICWLAWKRKHPTAEKRVSRVQWVSMPNEDE
jgi:hypothetical protein